MNKQYKVIYLEPEVFEKLAALAEREHRSLGKQVAALLDRALIVGVSELPHPGAPDAEPVPVVYINEASV